MTRCVNALPVRSAQAVQFYVNSPTFGTDNRSITSHTLKGSVVLYNNGWRKRLQTSFYIANNTCFVRLILCATNRKSLIHQSPYLTHHTNYKLVADHELQR